MAINESHHEGSLNLTLTIDGLVFEYELIKNGLSFPSESHILPLRKMA